MKSGLDAKPLFLLDDLLILRSVTRPLSYLDQAAGKVRKQRLTTISIFDTNLNTSNMT